MILQKICQPRLGARLGALQRSTIDRGKTVGEPQPRIMRALLTIALSYNPDQGSWGACASASASAAVNFLNLVASTLPGTMSSGFCQMALWILGVLYSVIMRVIPLMGEATDISRNHCKELRTESNTSLVARHAAPALGNCNKIAGPYHDEFARRW